MVQKFLHQIRFFGFINYAATTSDGQPEVKFNLVDM